jgi:aminoglycoside phosphotransferase (APT) family kinase protein
LRIYTADANACARELSILRLVHASVPVPDVFDADATASPPWALLEWIDGTRMDKLAPDDLLDTVHAAGAALAHIHTFSFERPGLLNADLTLGEPLGEGLGFVHEVIARRSGNRIQHELAQRLERVVADNEARLVPYQREARLLHCDYKTWNLLAHPGKVAAVLDWEFSVAGPTLFDLGIFLRYRDQFPAAFESNFLNGYRAAGGTPPEDVSQLTRLIDLINVCTFLDLEHVEPTIVRDLEPVILGTIQAFAQ